MQNPAQPFSQRVLSRLASAEASEPNLWYRDDLRIARLIVAHAARCDAVLCTPHVLASYEVLGVHPEKVWPAIVARRDALGQIFDLPPKKPAESVKLWCSENKNAARAINSRGGEHGPPRTSTLPMATASIAALYPNSDAPSSAKKRGYTYEETLAIVKFSGAPQSIRLGTLNALSARGPWPRQNGPAHGIICVSLRGMMHGNEEGSGNVVRSTARWRARRAVKLGYWREVRRANTWANCPKCGTAREIGTCAKCGYQGHSKTPEGKPNFEEFCRPFMYEIDIEKFRTAQRCREFHQTEARTYAEHKAQIQRAEQSNVTEMPARKPAQPASPIPAAPSAPLPQRDKPAAETREHRSTERRLPSLTTRQRAELVQRIPIYRAGRSGGIPTRDGGSRWVGPDSPDFREPMSKSAAILAACRSMCEGDETYGFRAQGVSMAKALEAAADAGFRVEPEGDA